MIKRSPDDTDGLALEVLHKVTPEPQGQVRKSRTRYLRFVVEELPKSVSSGRTIEEIALDQARVWRFNISVAENIKAGAIAARANDALAEIKGALKAARRP